MSARRESIFSSAAHMVKTPNNCLEEDIVEANECLKACLTLDNDNNRSRMIWEAGYMYVATVKSKNA